MDIRIAGMDSSEQNGNEWMTIRAQGCPHDCADCDCPEVQPFDGGTTYNVDDLWNTIVKCVGVAGIAFGGGEPFCQSGGLAELARRAKEMGMAVWTYTGYSPDELKHKGAGGGVNELLAVTDVLIDGRACHASIQTDEKSD